MEFINQDAFLMDGEALELTEEGVAEIVNDILEDWMLLGRAERLVLPTVERGTFSGFFENKNPNGYFYSESSGKVYRLCNCKATLVKKAS